MPAVNVIVMIAVNVIVMIVWSLSNLPATNVIVTICMVTNEVTERSETKKCCQNLAISLIIKVKTENVIGTLLFLSASILILIKFFKSATEGTLKHLETEYALTCLEL